MNRNDLLQKCVDRGVADETSVEAVSHLFYVYLLAALQRGQRVEVPNFGTFGTRVVGVKKVRRMPFFDVERELGEKVNDRFRQLKSLVLGRYELAPTLVEAEYKGREVPFEVWGERLGKEAVLDTQREIPVEEYKLEEEKLRISSLSKEKELMPKLNLKGDEMEAGARPPEQEPVPPVGPPSLREIPPERGLSPLWQVLLALFIIAAIVFALNYFGVIHLWGKRAPAVVETVPPPEVTTQPEIPAVKPPEAEVIPTPVPHVSTAPTPKVKQTPAPGTAKTAQPPAGKGGFTVQVSSWASRGKANAEAARLEKAGFSAYVEEGEVGGKVWHRVRVGRYATVREASEAAASLRQVLGDGFWVANVMPR